MTADEWLALEVGDTIAVNGGPERPVLEVSRVVGNKGQRTGATRTAIAVPSLKMQGRNIIIFSVDDTYGTRVQLIRKGGKLVLEVAEYLDRLPQALQAACRVSGWEQAQVWVRLRPAWWQAEDFHYKAVAGSVGLIVAFWARGERPVGPAHPQARVRWAGPLRERLGYQGGNQSEVEFTYALDALELAM